MEYSRGEIAERRTVPRRRKHVVGKRSRRNDDDDDEDETESLRKLPQYASESERFRKIDLAEEQKRERETLRAKRDERDQLRRLQNAEREKQKQEKERLAREMEETRLNFKRTHVCNRPNQSGCGWDPVNMKLNDSPRPRGRFKRRREDANKTRDGGKENEQ